MLTSNLANQNSFLWFCIRAFGGRTKKSWNIATVPVLLEKTTVVCSCVWGKTFSQDVPTFALVLDLHILAQPIVVLHLMELQNRRTIAFGRHPRTFPLLLLLDVFSPRLWCGQNH